MVEVENDVSLCNGGWIVASLTHASGVGAEVRIQLLCALPRERDQQRSG